MVLHDSDGAISASCQRSQFHSLNQNVCKSATTKAEDSLLKHLLFINVFTELDNKGSHGRTSTVKY